MSDQHELTEEEAQQVAAVLETCLDRGFDVEGVEEDVLERVRERLDRSAD